MRRNFDLAVTAMLGLLMALLVGNGVVTYHHIRDLYESRMRVDESRAVLEAIDDILSAAQDAETGVRGYLIAGDKSYLEPYELALPRLDVRLKDLRRLVANSGEQLDRIPVLRAQVRHLEANLEELLGAYRQGGAEGARVLFAEGGAKQAMDDLRRTTNRMRMHETVVRDRRAEASQQSRDLALASVGSATILGFILLAALVVQMRRNSRSRDVAADLLEGQKELFRTTLGSLGEAVVTCDPGGRVTYINATAEALTGWKATRAIGQPIADIVRVIDAERHLALENVAEVTLRDGVDVTAVHRGYLVPRGSDERRPVEESAAPIRDAVGAIAGAVLVFRDITERKRTENALLEADRRKDEFLAVLAHELRNPLAPLRNALHVVRIAGHDKATVQQVWGMMERQVLQMVRLIDDLLDVSRITRNKLELRREPIRLHEVIDAALEMSAPTVARFNHRVVRELGPDLPMVDGDRARLVQVLDNLVTNAAKYSEPGGTITVVAGRGAGDTASIIVKDTGLGIPPDMLERIFEMFTQVDRTLERSRGGLGIGLTLVRRIVQLHGGSIVARSEGPGRGSEFEITLPAAPQPAEPAAPAPGLETPPGGRKRIVVCDDNEDAAESLARMLRMIGHEVRLAFNGMECLAVCEEFDPDVVLLDIGMPRMNGYDTARALRARGKGPRPVLVAVTGWGQAEDRRRAFEAGFDHHLTKPADFDTLARLLHDAGLPAESLHA